VPASATLLLLAGLGSPAETPPPSTAFPVEAQVVYVAVSVADSRGRPVRNLRATDFALYENGRPVPAVAFHAPPGENVPGHAAAPAAPVADSARTQGPRPHEPVTFVVYIDNWNLTPQNRARALPALASFLQEELARGGARALVVSAGHDTHMLSPLTADAEQIAHAFRSAMDELTHGHVTQSDERQAIAIVEAMLKGGSIGCGDLPTLQTPLRSQAQARSHELEQTLARLETVVQALASLAGPKALFYLSGGLEQRPGIDLFHQLLDICPAAAQSDFSTLLAPMQEYDMSRAFQSLSARAGAARVTFYPVDASGLRGPPLGDLSEPDRRYVPSTKTVAVRTQNRRAGQWILADRTGGSATFDANNPKVALGQMADQIRSEYVLGFTPDHEPEDRIHVLRVELRRKGLRLRFTPSYLHAARGEPGASRTLAAFLAGLEEDTLGADVTVEGMPTADALAGATTWTASVRIGLPLARLSTVEAADGRLGRLRVVIAVWRAASQVKDRPLEIREKVIEVPFPSASSATGPDPGRREFVIKVPVSAAHREIGVGVIDALSRLATYRRLRVGS
jgi:VWFA-related protein